MLLDSQNLFSDNQAITTGTINSQNTVKFGKGDVSYLPLLIQSTSDFSNLTSLTVKIITSEDESFSTPSELIQATLTKAQLKAGEKFPLSHMPKGNKGFIKLQYVVTGTAETTGKITAGIVINNDTSIEE